jgi:hypothetical protein
MFDKFLEFIYMGVVTPILYLFYSIVTILLVFVLGLPIAIGFYLIQLAVSHIFGNTFNPIM